MLGGERKAAFLSSFLGDNKVFTESDTNRPARGFAEILIWREILERLRLDFFACFFNVFFCGIFLWFFLRNLFYRCVMTEALSLRLVCKRIERYNYHRDL